MVKIDQDELKNLERLGGGTFGVVYKKNDKIAYKIYRDQVVDSDCGRLKENPTLYLSKRRFKRLIERSKQLQYTGGVLDLIYCHGRFCGVVIPYYDNIQLNQYLDSSLNQKILFAKQIVRNSRELSNHMIYVSDYKLNNMLVSNGEVKIIDIDDSRTHVGSVPNPIMNHLMISGLGETLFAFFEEFKRCPVPYRCTKKLTSGRGVYRIQYSQIDSFIREKEKEHTILFIDDSTDLKKAREFLNHVPADVIYGIDFEGYNYPAEYEYFKRLQACEEHHIPLYDFSHKSDPTPYSTFVTTGDEYSMEKDQVKQLKKTR